MFRCKHRKNKQMQTALKSLMAELLKCLCILDSLVLQRLPNSFLAGNADVAGLWFTPGVARAYGIVIHIVRHDSYMMTN